MVVLCLPTFYVNVTRRMRYGGCPTVERAKAIIWFNAQAVARAKVSGADDVNIGLTQLHFRDGNRARLSKFNYPLIEERSTSPLFALLSLSIIDTIDL